MFYCPISLYGEVCSDAISIHNNDLVGGEPELMHVCDLEARGYEIETNLSLLHCLCG